MNMIPELLFVGGFVGALLGMLIENQIDIIKDPKGRRINKYVIRLLDEWVRHKKIILAIDFDDTILPYNLGNKKDILRVNQLIKEAQRLGAYIVIYTARHKDNWNEIREHCDKIGLPIDTINTNCMELPYGNHGKIYYNIFLDDRAGLTSALDTLEETMNQYKKYLKNK